MRIHFDGDLIIYRAGFAAEKAQYVLTVKGKEQEQFQEFASKRELNAHAEEYNIELVPDSPTLEAGDYYYVMERIVEPVENALYNVKSIIRRTLENLGTDDIIVYLSGDTNFRDGIATIKPYKGNRDDQHKPTHGPAIKEYLHKKYDVVVSENEEADDVVAYSHYRMWMEDETSTLIASTDKDLDMVPGLHYNFVKEESYYISPDEGLRWFYTQLLMGDPTDNIPGVPKVGKVKAAAALADAKTEMEMFDIAMSLYTAGYPDNPRGALIENAQLLWMRRSPDQWWQPPGEA
jgi:5'-3' exonuclease